jgi:hypothetical protein
MTDINFTIDWYEVGKAVVYICLGGIIVLVYFIRNLFKNPR